MVRKVIRYRKFNYVIKINTSQTHSLFSTPALDHPTNTNINKLHLPIQQHPNLITIDHILKLGITTSIVAVFNKALDLDPLTLGVALVPSSVKGPLELEKAIPMNLAEFNYFCSIRQIYQIFCQIWPFECET